MTGAPATQDIAYRRLLVKISGEALMGSRSYGIDMDTVNRIAADICEAARLGAQLCVVVGGGNIFRGLSGAAEGMDRATGDYMGMLATVMNALALQNAFEHLGTQARVLSAIPMPTVCEPFVRERALRHLEKGYVVIFAAGTGNPFFTTDTAAALRAAEMDCDALVKGTQVDGIYNADPKKDPSAKRYERLSFTEVLAKDLKVMDGAAIALARDNDFPIIVLSIAEEGNLVKLLKGQARCTFVSAKVPQERAG
ncbi:MAG: UMP kinase [Alphaproteobacteria bacterium]|nr:MAG: UMP kinase [Alphaproteobacteria bacterium]